MTPEPEREEVEAVAALMWKHIEQEDTWGEYASSGANACDDYRNAARAVLSHLPPRGEAKAVAGVVLTHDQLVAACRNIGHDLTCGECAAIFYTGVGGHPHDAGCATSAPPAPGHDARGEALRDLLALCDHANAGAWENGVTAFDGSMDEGVTRALGIMDKARAALAGEPPAGR